MSESPWESGSGSALCAEGIFRFPEKRPILEDSSLQDVCQSAFTEKLPYSPEKRASLVSPSEMVLLSLLFGGARGEKRDVALVARAARAQRSAFEWHKQDETNVCLSGTVFTWLSIETDSSSDDDDCKTSFPFHRAHAPLVRGQVPDLNSTEFRENVTNPPERLKNLMIPLMLGRQKDVFLLVSHYLQMTSSVEKKFSIPQEVLDNPQLEAPGVPTEPDWKSKRAYRAIGLVFEQCLQDCAESISEPTRAMVKTLPDATPGNTNEDAFAKVGKQLKGSAWWLHHGPRLVDPIGGQRWLTMALSNWQSGFLWRWYTTVLKFYFNACNVNAVSYILDVGPKFDPMLAAGAKRIRENAGEREALIVAADQPRFSDVHFIDREYIPKKHDLEPINLWTVKKFDVTPDEIVTISRGWRALRYPLLSFYVSGALIESVKWIIQRWEMKVDDDRLIAALIDSLKLQVSLTGIEYLQSIGTPFDKPCDLRGGTCPFAVARADSTARSVLLNRLETPGFSEWMAAHGNDKNDDDGGDDDAEEYDDPRQYYMGSDSD